MPTSSMTLLSARAKLPPARSPGTEQRLVHGRMVITPVRRLPLKERQHQEQQRILTTTSSCMAINMETPVKHGKNFASNMAGKLTPAMAAMEEETIKVRGRAHSSPPRITQMRGCDEQQGETMANEETNSQAGAVAKVEQLMGHKESPTQQLIKQDAGGDPQLVAGSHPADVVQAEEAFVVARNAGFIMKLAIFFTGVATGLILSMLLF